MGKPATRTGCGALSPVPRPTHDSRSARTARLQGARGHVVLPRHRGTRHVEVEKLNVNAGPVHQQRADGKLDRRKAKRDWQTDDKFGESAVGISRGPSNDAESKTREPT